MWSGLHPRADFGGSTDDVADGAKSELLPRNEHTLERTACLPWRISRPRSRRARVRGGNASQLGVRHCRCVAIWRFAEQRPLGFRVPNGQRLGLGRRLLVAVSGIHRTSTRDREEIRFAVFSLDEAI